MGKKDAQGIHNVYRPMEVHTHGTDAHTGHHVSGHQQSRMCIRGVRHMIAWRSKNIATQWPVWDPAMHRRPVHSQEPLDYQSSTAAWPGRLIIGAVLGGSGLAPHCDLRGEVSCDWEPLRVTWGDGGAGVRVSTSQPSHRWWPRFALPAALSGLHAIAILPNPARGL